MNNVAQTIQHTPEKVDIGNFWLNIFNKSKSIYTNKMEAQIYQNLLNKFM